MSSNNDKNNKKKNPLFRVRRHRWTRRYTGDNPNIKNAEHKLFENGGYLFAIIVSLAVGGFIFEFV